MKIIVINSAKGGVGKTEVSVGIAKGLKKRGHGVSLLDLDITTPNVPNIDDIPVFSAESGSEKSKTQIKKIIRNAINKSKKDGSEYLIIDTPPTVSSTYMAISETISNPKFIFVTTPSENAVKDTGVGIRFFTMRGIVPAGVIQNMTGSVFGKSFDSKKILGVETIGDIPLTEGSREPYFDDIVDNIEKISFEQGGVKESAIQRTALSKITVDELKESLEKGKITVRDLKFWNIETWDFVREMILDHEYELNSMFHDGLTMESHFNVPTEKLKAIIEEGDTATIRILDDYFVQNAPLPYEIQEASIIYDHKYARGLPVFVLKNGVMLWAHEVSLANDNDIKESLENGGIDLGNGRVLPSYHEMMYLNRAFKRDAQKREEGLIQRYIEESRIPIDPKDVLYSICVLENEQDKYPYEEFSAEQYIEDNKKEYPAFSEHLEKMVSVVETANKKITKKEKDVIPSIMSNESLQEEGRNKLKGV